MLTYFKYAPLPHPATSLKIALVIEIFCVKERLFWRLAWPCQKQIKNSELIFWGSDFFLSRYLLALHCHYKLQKLQLLHPCNYCNSVIGVTSVIREVYYGVYATRYISQ